MEDLNQDGSSNTLDAAAPATATESSTLHARPTVADLHGENHFAQVAKKNWLSASKTPKVRLEVIKQELWDELEKIDFLYQSLLVLENLQLLERYLWPGFTEDASNYHHLLLALMVNVKRRENLPSWEHFTSKPAEFSSFFRRILSMSVDLSQPIKIRTQLISFVIGAFQSLDSGLVRKECAPLVGISIWQNLHSDAAREQQFEQHQMLRKAWRAAHKRFEAGDETLQAKLRFERSWLYTLLLDFIDRLYNTTTRQEVHDNRAYGERFMELLTDLQSQLPTRRYVNTLLRDLNVLPAIRLSPMYTDEDNGLFRDLFNLLKHFSYFPIEDQTGKQLSKLEYDQEHYDVLAKLQRVGYAAFQEKLQLLALANYGSVGNRDELEGHTRALDDLELQNLCSLMGLRTKYPKSISLVLDRAFYAETLVSLVEYRPTFKDVVRDMPVLPTEKILYETTFLRNEDYNGSRPLAIPKLNLQYLTMGDFLWRSFILFRAESFYGIRKDIEDVAKRVQPRGKGPTTKFNGFSRMSLPISNPGIVDVAPPRVGEEHPAYVRAEIILDVSRLQYPVRREWESLKPDDVVFLLAMEGPDDVPMRNGHNQQNAGEELGVHRLRCAKVLQIQDDNGRPLRDQPLADGMGPRVRQRRLVVNIDAKQYQEDMDRVAQGRPNIYEQINLVVRRRGRENNFRPILESIRRLTLSDIPAPSWLQEVFLGYGDPASASYKRLPNRLQSIDFRDTFLDWQHLIESWPGKSIEPHESAQSSFGPPYIVQFPAASEPETAPVRQSKKRRRDQVEVTQPVHESLHASTYKPPNMGPYPADAPKLNRVRFTPAQIDAITSGTQPGLTVVVGPPGTGKTDVATQIISNIYHNFPDQRTLLVAHSNQALNQLFQKIVALDIDERHLLRLGHGEEELETEASYSKHGRVESFLERGSYYLSEVDRLAKSLGAPGAHGSSCETADYFNLVYVKPAWTQYWDHIASAPESRVEQIVAEFPFKQYFANAPQPLFPPEADREQVVDISQGCYRHVERIFAELEDIRPFEILRNPRDKANYLLVKEARIIAMTSTHAAMRRQEIASLGFHYDNVIMEEAAQITEIENFIPLALQNPQNNELPLQRIVMCGDHLQNSPIIQNLAFRQYANLEQSLFLRLVRLGVPTIMLDQQARARPSIAELYRWRYPNLGNLPSVLSSSEFQTANAGFKYDYQFIDVPDYKGKGESEPTPHFIQNLGEAEYTVALYMYMRLLGYPANKISILTTYAGQRALIKDVLNHRCKGNRLFGLPRIVATVDKYQGEQNDYILLSLVRTRSIGYLRDIRRLTVALSRARLGLYILGRASVFESCFELKPAFDILLSRPTKLALATDEMYGETARSVDEALEDGRGAVMEGVEHLGQYVFEMTKAKVESLKAGGAAPAIKDVSMANGGGQADDDEDIDREENVLVKDVDVNEDYGPIEQIEAEG